MEIKAVPDEEEILKEVRGAFEREPRIDPHQVINKIEIQQWPTTENDKGRRLV